jgi:hypothetical protein
MAIRSETRPDSRRRDVGDREPVLGSMDAAISWKIHGVFMSVGAGRKPRARGVT